jgi:hypothetical protein
MSDNTQTTEAKLSPEAKDLYNMTKSKYAPGGALPGAPQFSLGEMQGRGQKLTAPLSAQQNQGLNVATNFANQSGVANSINAAAQYTAPRLDFATGSFGNNFTTGTYDAGFAAPTIDTNFSAGNFANANFGRNNVDLTDTSGNSVVGRYGTDEISRFQNPYNDLVLNRGLDRLNEQTAKNYNLLNANVFGAGAFGGARHGVAEAEFADNALQTQGDFIAGQLQSGFNNAQNARMQEAGLDITDINADRSGEAQRVQALQGATQLGNQAQMQQAQGLNQAMQLGNQVEQTRTSEQNQQQLLSNQALGQQIAADNNQLAQFNNAQNQGLQNNLRIGAADQENTNNIVRMLMETGQLPRDYEQSVRSSGKADLQSDYQYPLAIAQAMGGMAAPPTTITSAPNNPMSSILPAAATLGAGLMSFSDERMKHDVGKAKSGGREALKTVSDYNANRKSWRYDHEPETRREGPMVQDMERTGHSKIVAMDDQGRKGFDVQSTIDTLMAAVDQIANDVARMKKRKFA